MASPATDFPVSSDALEQWRAAGGERLTYSEVAWAGAATSIVAHACLHFFSVAISQLERLLIVFAPAEAFAFGLTEGSAPIARYLLLLLTVGVWGALIGIALLSAAHELTDVFRRRR
jgi:hypothetical protein